MLKGVLANLENQQFSEMSDWDEISDLICEEKNLIWIDLLDPTEQELNLVGQEFNFHPLAMEDAAHGHQRPKVDEYEHFFFVIFYSISLNEKTAELEILELKIFVGRNYLVTVHSSPIKELDEAELRWRRHLGKIDAGSATLLYSLLDAMVDRYFPVVDALVEQAEDIEDLVFKGKAGDKVFTENLLDLKKIFMQLRRLVSPERDVLNVLTNRDSGIFHENTLIYFRDVFDHLSRVTDTLDLYRDQLSSIMDANLSVTSNDLNKVMRTLTSFSIILMSATLVPAIYGMNFKNIPELNWEFGYFGALALMTGIISSLIFFFKRRKWL